MKWVSIPLILLLITTTAADDRVMEIIPIKSTLVDSVLPTLRELVAPSDSLGAVLSTCANQIHREMTTGLTVTKDSPNAV